MTSKPNENSKSIHEVNSLQDLKKLQDDFYQAIFRPDAESIAQASRYVIGTKTLPEDDRLSIYRGSILGGITAGLTGIYPVCVKLVGEEFFTRMVAGYLKAHPSESPDLGNYGESLATYIAEFKAVQELVYLADVAQLEWLWHEAFNALDDQFSSQDLQPLTALEAVPEQAFPDVQFCVRSSASVMRSAYPVHRIWQVNQADYQGEQTVSLDEGAVKLVIWRSADYGMRVDELSDDEERFIAALLAGKKFSEVSEIHFSQALGEILQRCIQTGLIIGFKL